MNSTKLIKSTLMSSVVTALFIVAITIAGELYKVTGADGKVINPIKEYLKSLHGHHWVGKGVWAIALFVVLSFILYFVFKETSEDERLARYVSCLTWTLRLSIATFFAFFIVEYIISH